MVTWARLFRLWHKLRVEYEIKVRKALGQVLIGLALYAGGVDVFALRTHLAIARIELVHHIHALDHFCERNEELIIESFIVDQIDEDLGSAGAGVRLGESQRAAHILLPRRIVRDEHGSPFLVNVEVAMNAKLGDEARHYAKEPALIEVLHPHQLMEAIHAMRRPGSNRLHNKIALRCLKPHSEDVRDHYLRLFFLVASREQQSCDKNDCDAHPQLGYTGGSHARKSSGGYGRHVGHRPGCGGAAGGDGCA